MGFKDIVDVSNLQKGTVAKNYKDMCTLLGCEPCKGNGNDRVYQIKNWQRYFNFKKSGYKFIVTEIYDTPLSPTDARRTKEGKYNKYIELLLLRYLSACDDNMLEITKRGLYKVLGMVNQNYDKLTYDNCVEVIQSDIGHKISKFNINHFHQRVESKFFKILYNTLDSMVKRNLISYRKKIIITSDNGYNLENDGSIGSITALPYQEGIIEDTEQSVLDEWGYSNISQISLRYKNKEFYEEVNKRLNDEYEWSGYYTHVSICMLDHTDAQRLLAKDIRELSPSVQREQFNKLLINEVNSQSNSKYEKYQNGDVCDNSIKGFRYDESYLETQKELADYLLNLKYEDKYKSFWLAIDKRKEK